LTFLLFSASPSVLFFLNISPRPPDGPFGKRIDGNACSFRLANLFIDRPVESVDPKDNGFFHQFLLSEYRAMNPAINGPQFAHMALVREFLYY